MAELPSLTTGPFNWLDNKRVATSLSQTFDDIDPRTGQLLAKVQNSGPEDIEAAVGAAKKAFPEWSQVYLLHHKFFFNFYPVFLTGMKSVKKTRIVQDHGSLRQFNVLYLSLKTMSSHS